MLYQACAAPYSAARYISAMRRLISLLFSCLRLGIAAVLVFLCWQDCPAATASAQFEALPDFDFAAEARALLKQERFSESLLVIEAGLQEPAPAKRGRVAGAARRSRGGARSLACGACRKSGAAR